MLSGRGLTAFRILFFVLLATALVGVTVGAWKTVQRGERSSDAFYGAGIRTDEVLGRQTISSFGNPESTIVPRSTLLAVNGQAVPSETGTANLDTIVQALSGPDGARLRLTVRAPGGAETTHDVVRGPHYLANSDRAMPLPYKTRMAILVASNVIPLILAIVAAILLFRGRQRDPVVALLCVGFLLLPTQAAPQLLGDPVIASALDVPIQKAITVCIFLGLLLFPSGRFEPRWSLLGVPIIAATMFNKELFGVGTTLASIPPGLTFLVIGAAVLARYRRLMPGVERQQVKWAVLGLATFLLFALATLPLRWIDHATNDEGLHYLISIANSIVLLLAMTALFGGLIISLLRFRLYDAEAAISKSAVYAAMTVVLVGTFAATEKLIEILSERYFSGDVGAYAGAAGAGLAAVMIAPLHKRMSGWAERRFQKGLLRLRRDLPLLVGDLRETASTATLADTALQRIADPVRAVRGAILVATARGEALVAEHAVDPAAVTAWLAANPLNAAPLIDRDDTLFPYRAPLAADGVGTVGWLLLGPRPDGTMFGKDEREALDEVDESVARALAITRAREKNQLANDRERRGMAKRLRQLETMVFDLVGKAPRPA